MNLSLYLSALEKAHILHKVSGDLPAYEEVRICTRQQEVSPGDFFIAKRGATFDSHALIPDALERGAVGIIRANTDAPLPHGILDIQITNDFLAHAILAEQNAHMPAQNLTLLAVTGTNGKTTSAFLLQALVRHFTKSLCGLLSTVRIDNGADTLESQQTTPAPEEIQRLWHEMVENHCRYAVMEQSSHGLHQHRTGTARFDVAIFTNLTGDHLDYHHTTEDYYKAKERLFTELLSPTGCAILNIDDPHGRRLSESLSPAQRQITFGHENDADVRIAEETYSLNGTRFKLIFKDAEYTVNSPLIGAYNVANLTGVLLAIIGLGFSPETVFAELPNITFPTIPGRMEPIPLPSGATAFIDYAHTDDALLRAITALREVCQGKIITVFGCGGNRDKTKRPRMGKVASQNADRTIITSDNPRDEVPMDIIFDIKYGISAAYSGYVSVEADREKAIRMALEMANAGDAVLIAGKGHENYQEIRGVKHPFDDKKVVMDWIADTAPQISGI